MDFYHYIKRQDLTPSGMTPSGLKLMTKEPGVMRGPVIVVDNDKVILGYNRDRLEELIP